MTFKVSLNPPVRVLWLQLPSKHFPCFRPLLSALVSLYLFQNGGDPQREMENEAPWVGNKGELASRTAARAQDRRVQTRGFSQDPVRFPSVLCCSARPAQRTINHPFPQIHKALIPSLTRFPVSSFLGSVWVLRSPKSTGRMNYALLWNALTLFTSLLTRA